MTGRTKVLWVGEPPGRQENTEFQNRQLTLEVVGDTAISAPTLALSRGIVYRFSRTTLTATREKFTETVAAAVDHGLLVYLLADDDTVQGHLSTFLSGQQRADCRLRTGPVDPHELPEAMRSHDPGSAHNEALDIKAVDDVALTLDAQQVLLLKRAFSDCLRVYLKPLVGGLSANVFVAYATLKDSRVGPRPLPFFVKIDDRSKIGIERRNYDMHASHFIPFNLRPNLDPSRCIEASRSGILVGNFVEQSEPLWDVVRRGQAEPAIHSLFDDALRGWRLQAYGPPEQIGSDSIAGALSKKAYDYSKTKESYLNYAKDLGVTDAPIQLWETLIGLRGQRYRIAPMHGDLHGNNVRVRRGDAILIDLASIADGPLVADCAALETWLAFEVPPKVSDRLGGNEADRESRWRATVDKLYRPEAFAAVPLPTAEPSEFDWLSNCVRQLRAIVGPMVLCDTEYQSAVAVYLLRRTMWDGADRIDSSRRGYAYVLAAHLIADLARKGKPG